MAIVGGQQDDEELQNGKNQPMTGGGQGGFVGGAPGGGPTTKAAAAPTNSGGYTNLQSYLQANQGGGATTGKAAENVVNQAGTKADTALTDYTGKADNEISTAGQGLGVDKMKMNNIAAGGATVDQKQMSAIKGGVAKVDQKNMDAIKGGDWAMPKTAYSGPKAVKAGTYSGPNAGAVNVAYKGPTADTVNGKNTVTGYGADAQAAQTAAMGANQEVFDRAGQAAGGQTGVSALLQSAYQQPSYTAGENSLDAFLANGTPEGQKALSGAGGVAKNAAGAYQNINDVLSGKIKSEQGMAGQTNDAYAAAIAKAQGQTGAVQKQYDAAIAKAKGDTTAAKAYQDAIHASEVAAYKPKQVVFARRPEPVAAPAPQDPNQLSTHDPNNYTPNDLKILAEQAAADAANGREPVSEATNQLLPQPVQNVVENVQEETSPAAIYNGIKSRLLGG